MRKTFYDVSNVGEAYQFLHGPLVAGLLGSDDGYASQQGNDVLGVKFSGQIAALIWRLTYLYKLESPESRARIAVDWLLDIFYDPPVTQIRR